MFYLEQFDLIKFRPIGAVGEIINMKQVHSQGSNDRVFRTESTTRVIAKRGGIAFVAVVLTKGPLIPH